MYIVGKYYQGNPEQKPEQWGTTSDVQHAVQHWCEEWLGVSCEDLVIAIPGWTALNKALNFGFDAPSFTGQFMYNAASSKKYGIDLTNRSLVDIGITFNNADGDEFSIFIDSVKRGSSTTQAIVAGWNNSTMFGYIGLYPNLQARLRFDTHCNFTAINKFNTRNQIVFTCDKNRSVKAFQEGTFRQEIIQTNTAYSLNQLGSNNRTYGIDDATIYNFLVFSTALNNKQVELLSGQPSKLFEPILRPLYFDFTDLPVSPEYASVISEKVNTISEFQKEGLFSSTISEKTNLISGVQKQAEISSVLSEKNNILSVGSASEEISFSSIVSEKANIISDGFKQTQTEKTISETTNLEASVQKTGYYASAITEKTNIVSTGSSEDIEIHSYSSIISGKTNFETTFFKGAVTDSFISEDTNINSEFYKTAFLTSVVSEPSFFSSEVYKAINYQSIISERVNLISIITGGLLVRPVLNTSIEIEEDRLTILLAEDKYSYGVEQ